MLSRRKKTGLVGRIILLLLLVTFTLGASEPGCAPSATDNGTEPFPDGGSSDVDEKMAAAQVELANNEIDRAQGIYGDIIAEHEDPPGATYAGKAVTDLLLLPGSNPATTIVAQHLGAAGRIDASDAIYADEGYLYWLVRGVPWLDDGDYSGIRTLIADRLPWAKERLGSLESFFAGLDKPVDTIMDDMIVLADAMSQIEDDIDRALDDPDFQWIYVPGRAFHYEDLDLLLGRSELYLIKAAVAATRATIYFTAAYEHSWTLDAALSAQPAASDNPREGWTTIDYAIEYLDPHLGRTIGDPFELREARTAYNTALYAAMDSINAGLDAETETTLRWTHLDAGQRAHAEKVVALLSAIRTSLYEPMELPGSQPKTTLDLTPFFVQGRTLPAEIAWFERVEPAADDTSSFDPYWRMTDQARQTFFVDGVFEPGFDITESSGPELEAGGERMDKLRQAVSGELQNNVEDAFFTTR